MERERESGKMGGEGGEKERGEERHTGHGEVWKKNEGWTK